MEILLTVKLFQENHTINLQQTLKIPVLRIPVVLYCPSHGFDCKWSLKVLLLVLEDFIYLF